MAIKGIEKYTDWLNESVLEITRKNNKKLLYNLWDEIVPFTPVQTGLAMYSWRMTPGQKSTYKPVLKQGEGELFDSDTGAFAGFTRVFPEPERPNIERYGKRKFENFYLFNNQDYVANLNEDESKHYYQFIDDGIKRAVAKTKSK